MNNEIKEILDKAKEISKYGADGKQHTRFFNQFEAKSLLDYITNLQQENETRQQDINNLTYQLAKMKEENERLKEELDYIKPKYDIAMDLVDKGVENSYKMVKDYKSRLEKAVEYIKDIFKDEKWYENYEYNDLENALKNVLNILQNGSDSQ